MDPMQKFKELCYEMEPIANDETLEAAYGTPDEGGESGDA